ncbi:hypothetical protein TRFO_29509 [Tritrichomonas foetus]|uniref:Uncharacterized protein n=1 Tax=Tritrichomonas foetus TaxID=1144522 RepID=A0A1J4JXL1_9EUKA|nr:hypothetical protein TRFO_29509 [Tritrichomonas foetus]|eukprot:OHT03200.1 hypothetical protein TRFO_29509 [Tritrichomonas foetus]
MTKQNPISKNIQKDPQKPLNGIKPKNETTGNKSRPTSSHLYKTAIQKAQASPASSPRSGVSPENTNKKAIDRSSFSSSMARQSANKSLNKGLDKSVKASEKKNCNTLLTKDSPNSRGSARGSKNSNLNKNQVAFKKMKNSVNNNNDEDFTQKKKNQPDLIEIDADDTKTGTSNSILKNPISSEDLETLDGFISLTNQNSIQENTEHCKKPYQIQSFDAFYVPNAFDIKIIFNEEKQINENVTNDGLYEFELLNQKYNEIADILNSNEFRQFYDGEIPEILLEKF